MSQIVRVKYFQPASQKGFAPVKLDGLYDHPARYVYCVCWLNNDNTIGLIGGQGRFPVIDSKCKGFLGYWDAEIIETLDESHLNDADYYELAE